MFYVIRIESFITNKYKRFSVLKKNPYIREHNINNQRL